MLFGRLWGRPNASPELCTSVLQIRQVRVRVQVCTGDREHKFTLCGVSTTEMTLPKTSRCGFMFVRVDSRACTVADDFFTVLPKKNKQKPWFARTWHRKTIVTDRVGNFLFVFALAVDAVDFEAFDAVDLELFGLPQKKNKRTKQKIRMQDVQWQLPKYVRK